MKIWNFKFSKNSKNVSKLLQILKCLNFHIYLIMTNPKNVMHWGNFKYFLEQDIKYSFKIHLHAKVIFGKMNLLSFSKVISLALCYTF
jgi:hypothetical protein